MKLTFNYQAPTPVISAPYETIYRTGDDISSTGATSWTRDDGDGPVAIPGATAATYTLQSADEFCIVAPDNGIGAFILPVLSTAVVTPAIGGAVRAGNIVSCASTYVSGWPYPRITGWSWKIDGVEEGTDSDFPIPPGATGTLTMGITVASIAGTATYTTSGVTIGASTGVVDDYGVADPSVSYNIGPMKEFQPTFFTINRVHQCRPWVLGSNAGGNLNTYEEAVAAGAVDDATGWPTGVADVSCRVGLRPRDEGATFNLTWDGAGSVVVGSVGSTVNVSYGVNSATVVCSGIGENGGGVFLSVPAGEEVTNIAFIRSDLQALYDAGEIWSPDVVEFHKDTREIRFMDWMLINENTTTDWASRAQNPIWAAHGVPLEMCVDFANRVHADAWICIPHLATPDYITNAANYIRDNLDADLRWIAEYSNECWNGSFPVTSYLVTLGTELWPGQGSNVSRRMNAQGKKHSEMVYLIDASFVGQLDRVKRAFGSQTPSNSNTATGLNASYWAAEGFYSATLDVTLSAPFNYADALAYTGYIGSETWDSDYKGTKMDGPALVALTAAIEGGASDAEIIQNVMAGYLDIEAGGNVPGRALIGWTIAKNIADDFGLDMIAYEGSYHAPTRGNPGNSTNNTAEWDALIDFRYTEEAAEIIAATIWLLKNRIGLNGPYMQFVDFGQASAVGASGFWGMADNPEDVKLYGQMLQAYNRLVPNGDTDSRDFRSGSDA